jgi:UDP:flavonoid glycosyltransferase YjiC (YdhE family)
MNLAFFISSHGYGHAARASAIMAALHARHPALHFEIFTHAPRWFFEGSLPAPFTYHSALTDVGLAQTSPLAEDLPQTVQRLNEFLPFDEARVAALAAQVSGCALALCDISPLGIAAARRAGIPSVLVENFTWDWIYEGYVDDAPGLRPHIEYLRGAFASADYHIRTAPANADSFPAHLLTRPVSRSPRTALERVREQLGIPPEDKTVFVTMGGVRGEYAFLNRLTEQRGLYFVVPGGSEAHERRGNVILLPHHSEFYHPDVLNACDAVVGKAGYSTLAETYHAGVPYGYIARPRFRESGPLANFIRAEMHGLEIPAEHFEDGDWLASLPDLLALPRTERREPNGAAQATDFIAGLLKL